MPITTTIYNAYSHKINSLLSDIEEQFTLDEHALISITSHFHKLFNLGLSEYGHPMAMMYVFTQHSALCPSHLKFHRYCSPTFVTGVPDGTEMG